MDGLFEIALVVIGTIIVITSAWLLSTFKDETPDDEIADIG